MIEITQTLVRSVAEEAEKSPRKRKNYNFHKQSSDLIQRMLNALEPGTYIQPHKHENPDKREVFIILSGKAVVIEFTDDGKIDAHLILEAGGENIGIEIAPGIFHVIIALTANAVVYEIKDGPYEPLDDKNFAVWAPKEGDENCDAYLQSLLVELGVNAET